MESGAFASAELVHADPGCYSEQFLASIVARQLVRTRCKALWAIDVLHGEIEFLLPAGSRGTWLVDRHASTWQYRVDLCRGRAATKRVIYPSCKSCLPFSNMRRTRNGPGAGVSSPLGYARQLLARLAGNLELRLAEEANAKVGYLLPVPSDGGDGSGSDPLAMLKSDLAALAGSVALIETTSAGFGEGRAAAPQCGLEGATNGRESARNAGGASQRCGRGHFKRLRRPAWAGKWHGRGDEPA